MFPFLLHHYYNIGRAHKQRRLSYLKYNSGYFKRDSFILIPKNHLFTMVQTETEGANKISTYTGKIHGKYFTIKTTKVHKKPGSEVMIGELIKEPVSIIATVEKWLDSLWK